MAAPPPATMSTVATSTTTSRVTTSAAASKASGADIPLTTVFTPPSSCFTDISWNSPYGYPGPYSVALGPLDGCSPCWLGLRSSHECLPSGWDTSAVYSPGLCPHGYSIACSSINNINSLFETIATCCPSGYSCLTPVPGTWPWISTELCASSYGSGNFNFSALSITDLVSGSSTLFESTAITIFPATRLSDFSIYAHSIQVRFQSTDFTTTKTTSSAHTHTTVVSPQPCCSPKSLSPGGKAGIAISIIFLLGILLGTFFFIRKRQKQRSSALPADEGSAQEGNSNIQGLYLKPELEAGSVSRIHKQDIAAKGNELAELHVQDVGAGISEMGNNSGNPSHRSYSDVAEAPAPAETASIKPHSITKRKPIQQTHSHPAPPAIPELQPTPGTPTPEPDITTPTAPIVHENSPPPLETPSARYGEQADSPKIHSTVQDSSLQHTENPAIDEEEEWLKAELARVQERKERVREMQRLKEEEERLTKEEDALRKRMRAKTDIPKTTKHGLAQ